jgi:hypothetical protein
MARPKKVTETKEASVGMGDAGIFHTILQEAEASGVTLQVPTRKDINQQGVEGNLYRGDAYIKNDPTKRLQFAWWAPPRGDGDSQAYIEKARLDDGHYTEVIAHPEEGPYVVANRFRKDAGYRVFNGVKQLFARDYQHFLDEEEEKKNIANNKYNREMDNLDAMAERMGIGVEETRGGVRTMRTRGIDPKRRRIYSK